jgi:hypothetical protein
MVMQSLFECCHPQIAIDRSTSSDLRVKPVFRAVPTFATAPVERIPPGQWSFDAEYGNSVTPDEPDSAIAFTNKAVQ